MLRAIDAIGEPRIPIELNALEVDNSGTLCGRAPKFPLAFHFTRRDCNFGSLVDQVNGQMTLELSLNLGDVPFGAEDAAKRRVAFVYFQRKGTGDPTVITSC